MNESSITDPLLLGAVPPAVRADADAALGALPRPDHPTMSVLIQDTNGQSSSHIGIRVEGELVQIPYRIYYGWPEFDRTQGLSPEQLLVLAAWMSRHSDGRIRQAALRQLLEADASWTIPFVVQLCGEYIVEIGSDLLHFFEITLTERPGLRQAYVQFTHDNPAFISLTAQRALSYWNAYDRWRFHRDQYPQLAALKCLALLASPSSKTNMHGYQ
ncbi:hypothetical protein [Paenarthrobacter sp. 2TAF44]|uniref:hypothetical protein n=1 Tax=Paenarthrobacter sp. 2TAF44 TaxID=3233018 RepID=UPI003F9C648F